MNLETLKTFCVTKEESEWMSSRHPFREPFTVRSGDERWAVAASGPMMVAVRADLLDVLPPDATDKQAAFVFQKGHPFLPAVRGPLNVLSPDLRHWCGDHVPAREVRCPGCSCGECGGQDYTEPAPQRPGRLFGVLVDRNLLAKALAARLHGPIAVTIPENGSPLALDGPGWRVLLMPMTDGEYGPIPVFPPPRSEEADGYKHA